MRMLGTVSRGIRLPIISPNDNLVPIVVDSLLEASNKNGFEINDKDILGITESIVAKAQNNFASVSALTRDVEEKFPESDLGIVYPILSRNRFLNILKGVAGSNKKIYILLKFPNDEVGNPIMDSEVYDELYDELVNSGLINEEDFRRISKNYVHPFTSVDYIDLYKSVSPNIEVYFSNDPRDILKLTKNVLVAEIHTRFSLKKRLTKAGAETVYTLSDLLNASIDGSGYNEDYGVLGSNISTGEVLKLFPRGCKEFASEVQAEVLKRIGKTIEVLVYGDGAFKDPVCGIWELADPVVSPGFTEGLSGKPSEVKLKYLADNNFADLSSDEKQKAVSDFIKQKDSQTGFDEGTTPRRYTDLLGSLCDLMSGSGDKGTPVIYIQGYFDDYSMN